MGKKGLKAPRAAESSPLAPPWDWSWFANAPLKGAGLLRERQWIYAWDDANSIYLVDRGGALVAQNRMPREIVAVAGADAGGRLVAASRFGAIWWLDESLNIVREIECPFAVLALAIDGFGDYCAAGGELGRNLVLSRTGKRVAQFNTRQAAAHLAFNPLERMIIAAADDGTLSAHDWEGGEYWRTSNFSTAGAMAIDGTGEVVLLACFSHGLVRFGVRGKREGTYRVDGSPALVATDFEGHKILTATVEGALTELDYGGIIRGHRPLPDRPIALSLDALGRYAVLAYSTGEVRCLPLPAFWDSREAVSSNVAGPTRLEPAWEIRATASDDETKTAHLAAVPGKAHVAVFSDRQTIRVYDERGERFHESPAVSGTGRTLLCANGWLAAATDHSLVGYDPIANRSVRSTLSHHELSHIELLRPFGECLVIESAEFLTRFRLPGETLWRKRLPYRVESAACQPDGTAAVVLEDKNLVALKPNGELLGKYRPRPVEPLQLLAIDQGWITTGRESQSVRLHELSGKLLWTTELPWPPWNARRFGSVVLVTSVEGQSVLINGAGEILKRSDERREGARYFMGPNGKVIRVFLAGQTVLVSSFSGRLLWRIVDEHAIGELEAGPTGLWVFLGRHLSYYPFQ